MATAVSDGRKESQPVGDSVLVVELRPRDVHIDEQVLRDLLARIEEEMELSSVDRVGAGSHGDRIRLLFLTEEIDKTWMEVRGWMESEELLKRSRVTVSEAVDGRGQLVTEIWEGELH